MDDNNNDLFYVPHGYGLLGGIFSEKWKNFIEMVVVDLTALNILLEIPFVFKIKIVVIASVLIFLSLLFFAGMHDQSVVQFMLNYAKLKIKGKVYYLERPMNKGKQVIEENTINTVGREGEALFEKIKTKIGEFLYR